MARMDMELLSKELNRRAQRRQKMQSSSDRDTEALEGIYDELTNLTTLVAAMLAKMR